MKLAVATLSVSVLLGCMLQGHASVADEASVGGTVRDLHGMPVSGAVVELLAPNAVVLARALSDAQGHYVLHALSPGQYQVRATLAALLPALRSDLRLHAGSHAVADLTLAALFETGTWLPAEHRTATEPNDDWRWTLRSTANRPLLRLVGDESSDSQSSGEIAKASQMRGYVSLLAGDGSFGQGGPHQVLLLDRDQGEERGSVLRADLGPTSGVSSNASATVDAGMQRLSPLGGGTRVLVSLASHPEFETAGGGGWTTLQSAVARKLVFGDLITADVGSLFTAARQGSTVTQSAPYLRIEVAPSSEIVVEYRLATNRALQSFSDLDEARLPENALSDAQGRPLLVKAMHQEVNVSRHTEATVLTVAVFQDRVSAASLQGVGVVHGADLSDAPLIADAVTGTLHLAAPGFAGRGARAAVQQRLGEHVSAVLEAHAGPALQTGEDVQHMADVPRSLSAHMTAAVAGTLLLTSRQSGTRLSISYRWQPNRTRTTVDEFDGPVQQAYLGVRFRQRLWTGKRLREVCGTVDARNLLAEAYLPLEGAEGQKLFLASVPRALQAGLTFNF